MRGPLPREIEWLPLRYFVEDETGPLWDGRMAVPPAVGDVMQYEGEKYLVEARIWTEADETLGIREQGYGHEFLQGDFVCVTLKVGRLRK